MATSFSKRVDLIYQSEIRNMSLECDRVGGINLSQGVCDTEVPEVVRRGAQSAMDEGVNSYTRYDGIDEIRHAIAGKMRSYNGVECDPDKEVVVSVGSTGAFYSACLALLDPGDEVILFEPFYGYHLNTLLAVEVTPKYVTLTPPDWTFAADELEAAITPKTKAVMICTPANPSGKVWTEEEIGVVAEVSAKHDLFVFTDEIYEYFLYDGRQHVSPGSCEGFGDRCITMSGYSKTFSITGWRIGYSVTNERWSTMIGYMNDLIYVCAPAPLQAGVAAGIDALGDDFYAGLITEYAKKRDKICSAIDDAGMTPYVPQGAYYVLADASALPGDSSKAKAMHLLEKTGVATVPGEAFYRPFEEGCAGSEEGCAGGAGGAGGQMLRFCYAKEDAVLDEACERLAKLR